MFDRRKRNAILSADDECLQKWHLAALRGDERSKSNLIAWVYYTALEYFGRKSIEYGELSREDVSDLAGQFIMDFQHSWKDIRRVSRYTRSVMRRSLQRFLAAKQSIRTMDIDIIDSSALSCEQEEQPWMTWSDRGHRLYIALCQEYFAAPTETMTIIDLRLGDSPVPYALISEEVGLNEGATRMRATRFFKRVRERFENLDDRRVI